MRSLVDPAAAPRARPAVRVFLIFAALALLAFAAQRALQGGLTPSGVEALYLGPDGAEPIGAIALWEELHTGAFVYGFSLFMLGALAAAAPARSAAGRGLFGAAAVAAGADLAAPFVVHAAGGAGLLRVITTALAFGLLAALLVAVSRGTRRAGGPARG